MNSEKTIEVMLSVTRQFLTWLEENNIDIMTIEQDTLDDYLAHCYTTLSKNSMIVVTANLRKLLEHFLNIRLDIKIARPTAPKRDKTSLTKEEVKAMFTCASGNTRELSILKTLYYTGIRNSELVNLNLEDIDFNRLQITIKHGKGNKSRCVNMTTDCSHAIQTWLVSRPKPKKGHETALYLSPRNKRITATYVTKIVKKIAAMAGIKRNMYPHKLRITNITHMAEAGLSINEIQAQSGHSDTKTIIGYIQHTASRIRNGYDRTFQDLDDTNITPDNNTLPINPDSKRYKKIAITKYLNGEIDTKTLHSILSTLDKETSDAKNIEKMRDLAYQ